MLSSGANCVALKVGTSCTRMILFPNKWTAEMHLSSMYVNHCRTFFETNLFLDSMSNLLIETSAIETFPKSSSFKRSLGNSYTSLSFIPKSKELKTKEPQDVCLAVIRQV